MGILSWLFGGSSDSDGAERQAEILREQKTIRVAIRSQEKALENANTAVNSLRNKRDKHDYGSCKWESMDQHVHSAEETVAGLEHDIHCLNQQLNDLSEEYVRIGRGD